ncbi:MAG: gfo/Idh/MocA family oxidoreductase [Alphaproteobacteria bacterium]|nr:gfo/Idh/MocA family oxidoreductase [Alphaproteobacteria bacterium]
MAITGKDDGSTGGRIRLGMVGGGEGAFIGAVHRLAARMDDQYSFVAGALSSTPEKSSRSGASLGLDPKRTYGTYEEMAKKEGRRKDGIEAVAIVTPNHMHAGPALAFLKAGIHVICDKPLTTSLKEALKLQAAAEKSGKIFAVTHNYTGYPMVRQARAMIAAGELGEIRVVQVEYPQDWLAEPLEQTGQKQADWRTDPSRSGAGGCIGDIGTHAYNLADFITNIPVVEVSAELTTFVEGRRLDDDTHVRMHYANGAKGTLWASQVAVGNENALRIRVYGTKGGISWSQENPNYLQFSPISKPTYTITRGGAGSGAEAGRMTRIPPGHPEGYLEGFANIYTEIAHAIRASRSGIKPDAVVLFPTIHDGVKGLAFIEAAIASSAKAGRWTKV